MRKGVHPLVSTVLVVMIFSSAVAIVLLVGLPTIERAKESAVLNEAMQNMRMIANTIKEVASEGANSLRTLRIRVSGGEYKVNEKTNSIDFTYAIKSNIVQFGSFIKEDNIIFSAGANAKAGEYDLDNDGIVELVLENEFLRVGILKNGTKDNFAPINTSKLIKILNFKETNANVTPSDSSIILDDYIESSYGNGYSELVKTGDHLAKAEATVHMNTTYVNYDILYTLQSGADFLTVKIMNAYYK